MTLTASAEKLRRASDLYDSGSKPQAVSLADEVWATLHTMSGTYAVQPGLQLLAVGLGWLNVQQDEAEVAAWIDLGLPMTHLTPGRHAAISDLNDAIEVAERSTVQAISNGLLPCDPARSAMAPLPRNDVTLGVAD